MTGTNILPNLHLDIPVPQKNIVLVQVEESLNEAGISDL